MRLHRIVIDMVAQDDGDMVVEVEIDGEPSFVTALGMVEMARDWLLHDARQH